MAGAVVSVLSLFLRKVGEVSLGSHFLQQLQHKQCFILLFLLVEHGLLALGKVHALGKAVWSVSKIWRGLRVWSSVQQNPLLAL